MPRIVCRTCGDTRDVSGFNLYSPVHIFPGIIYVYCPTCRRYRLHRKVESPDVQNGKSESSQREIESQPKK